MPDRRRLAPLYVAAGALVLTAVLLALGLVLGGYDPHAALSALVRGAFGSRDAFLSVTLVRAVPLILTGLAVALAFRAGVWNIGAEGQLYAGAIAGVWVGLTASWLPAWALLPAVLGASLLAGATWALVPAMMKLKLGVGEVITTILMNFVAIHAASFMVRGPLQESRGVFPQTDAVGPAARLPLLVDGSRLHGGFLLAVLLCLGLWAFLRWSRAGFAVRAVGGSVEVAEVAGRIRSRKVVGATFLASGALAGLAGGVEVSGVTFALYENLSPGWGYTAIAVALLAGLNPIGVLVTGTFFGALQAGAGAMQRSAGVPAVWVVAVEALVILAVLGLDQAWRRAMVPRGSAVAHRALPEGSGPKTDRSGERGPGDSDV